MIDSECSKCSSNNYVVAIIQVTPYVYALWGHYVTTLIILIVVTVYMVISW